MPIRPASRAPGRSRLRAPRGSSSTNAGFEHNSRPKISATGRRKRNDRGAFTLTLTSRMSSSKIERSASSSSHTSSEYTYASSSSSSSSSPQMPSSEGEARKWRATNATAASTRRLARTLRASVGPYARLGASEPRRRGGIPEREPPRPSRPRAPGTPGATCSRRCARRRRAGSRGGSARAKARGRTRSRG